MTDADASLTGGRQRFVVVFLDGVGIGEDDPDVNPFMRARAVVPTLQKLVGGIPSRAHARLVGPTGGRSFPIDARLDVEGTPQSGTGQAALLTGENAAEIFGRHFGPWTPVALRPLVEEQSVLRRAVDAGLEVAFANAYPRGWPGPRGGRRIAGPPLAARGAGLLTRHEEALGAGDAVSSEIVNDGWQRHLGHDWLPVVSEGDAGRHLAAIANRNDLTLYAHYTTDTVGHRGSMEDAVAALARVDRFLSGLTDALTPSVTLLLVSDHGNIEDVRGGHTLNPVLGVAHGPAAEAAGGIGDLREVAPFLLAQLGIG